MSEHEDTLATRTANKRLRVFSVIDFAPAALREQLGQDEHVVQARYYVAASSQRRAVDALNAAGRRMTMHGFAGWHELPSLDLEVSRQALAEPGALFVRGLNESADGPGHRLEP